MKPNTFSVAVIAFVATTATIGNVSASLWPTLTYVEVCVRRIENNPPTTTTSNRLAGIHNLNLDPSGTDLLVEVTDTNTPAGQDTRKGRFLQGPDNIIRTASPTTITPPFTITVP